MKIQEVKAYFANNVGPVFVTPSAQLLFRYKKMDGMLGLVRPPYSGTGALRVDWTLDKRWSQLGNLGRCMEEESLIVGELTFLELGSDIPQEADDRYLRHNWAPKTLGDVVCISDARFREYKKSYQLLGSQYDKIRHMVGVVVEKCEVASDYTMVTFTKDGESHVLNVPNDILVKLPESFRPSQNKKPTMPVDITPSKPKFAVGETVYGGSAITDETFMGLLGVVLKIHEVLPTGYKKTSDWEYTVDFNLLPNRCLEMCEGEGDAMATVTRLPEKHLMGWDERISDKPYLGIYRAHAERERVWVPHRRKVGKVDLRACPQKSIEEGMQIKVIIDGSFHSMTCRDVDYKWNHKALLNRLRDSFVALGVEQNDSNPNIPKQQYVYLYLFDYGKDVGEHVQTRVLLGSLLKRKSTQKKFVKALLAGKLTHPWQVIRYLKVKSLGYFYECFKAEEYLAVVSEFVHVVE